jgi:alkylation response protein AidB-like acyl-CoA dehydrogenase
VQAALEQLTHRLARLATHYDVTGEWPEEQLKHLDAAGAWTWVIPREFGGLGLNTLQQTLAYEAIAAGCMSSLLILTQRDGACELIATGASESLKQELLPRMARNECLATVGISQLTTSHQGGRPALSARRDGAGYRLRGFMPWVTSAAKCEFIVAGAALSATDHLLAVVRVDEPGVIIDPAMQMMALQASWTSEVHCKDVFVADDRIIRGPMPDVLSARSPVKPLVVSASGVGLAGAMMKLIEAGAVKASDQLKELAQECAERLEAVRARLIKYAESPEQALEVGAKTELRVAVNDLLVRLSAGVLTFAKGGGFLRQRDAQRLVREAMFFLVWSAPEDVRAGTLAHLLDEGIGEPKSAKWL